MMRRPPEITEDEWDALTSPENYYCDGEVSRAQADKLFKQKVDSLVASRRAAGSPSTRLNTSALKVGDTVREDAKGTILTVHRIAGPGTYGVSYAQGPRVYAWIRPGGYGVTIDASNASQFSLVKGHGGGEPPSASAEDALIARRVRGGANEAQSRALLAQLRVAHAGDNLAHALVHNGFATEAQARKYAGTAKPAPRKEWVGARRARKTLQLTNAAALSRVLNTEAGGGYLVTQATRRRVMVQNGKGSAGLPLAAKVLESKGYVFTTNGQHIVVTGRYV